MDELDQLRALSARLADLLRPHWPQIFQTYVPVDVRWPDDRAGTHVEVMTEAGAEIVLLAQAPAQIRRCYLQLLDARIAIRAEDGEDAAELEALRGVIAEVTGRSGPGSRTRS